MINIKFRKNSKKSRVSHFPLFFFFFYPQKIKKACRSSGTEHHQLICTQNAKSDLTKGDPIRYRLPSSIYNANLFPSSLSLSPPPWEATIKRGQIFGSRKLFLEREKERQRGRQLCHLAIYEAELRTLTGTGGGSSVRHATLALLSITKPDQSIQKYLLQALRIVTVDV